MTFLYTNLLSAPLFCSLPPPFSPLCSYPLSSPPPSPQVKKLQAILKPMMLRRLKDDVEKNLAPKEETIIEVSTCFICLTDPRRELWNTALLFMCACVCMR